MRIIFQQCQAFWRKLSDFDDAIFLEIFFFEETFFSLSLIQSNFKCKRFPTQFEIIDSQKLVEWVTDEHSPSIKEWVPI